MPISCIDKSKLRRTLFDNASNLLTNFLAGGNFKDMPVVNSDVTDLLDWLHFLFLWLDFVIYFDVSEKSKELQNRVTFIRRT
jgi:hypothetical protein